jgi:hypothetical protein
VYNFEALVLIINMENIINRCKMVFRESNHNAMGRE